MKGTSRRTPLAPVAAALAGLLLLAGSPLLLDWPWWAGISIGLLGGGAALGALLLYRLWLRNRERRFPAESVAHDAARAESGAPGERGELESLQQRFKSAVGALCHSNLGKHGNPLYVLPWYLIIGHPGSGKSSALGGAKLSSPLPGPFPVDPLPTPTAQCDWWFFENAVVIDTAGRYALPSEAGTDREEWQKLLSLLVKYRRKEPLNGVVVAVSAGRLLEAGAELLASEAASIRGRIEELMRGAGVRIPVYLLVTKCDLVRGMESFFDCLPSQSFNQPFGALNHALSEVGQFGPSALGGIDERLRSLRLQLLYQPQNRAVEPELLLFPEEFSSLRAPLLDYLAHLCGPNRYQETPVLRGLFFSSARQDGRPHSRFGTGAAVPGDRPAREGADTGFFLHDFFGRVLPADRPKLRPTRRSLEWRLATGNLGLTAWLVVWISLCGVLSFSFVKNLKAIRAISHSVATSTGLHGGTPADLAGLQQFRREILEVEKENLEWWIPRFGLKESLELELALKERFCRQFQRTVLAPLDAQLAAGVATLSRQTPDEVYAEYLVHLVRRSNLIRTRLEQKPEALELQPQPAWLPALGAPVAAAVPDTGFGALHLSWLHWKQDPEELGKETAFLRSALQQALAARRDDLRWLAGWVNLRAAVAPVTLKDFWQGSRPLHGEREVAPVFTLKGKKALDMLLDELEAALPDPDALAPQKAQLMSWHRDAAMEAWRGFAEEFGKGEKRLEGGAEWRRVASGMASEQGPYFALLDRMVLELEPLRAAGPVPAWLTQVFRFQEARAQARSAALAKAAEGTKRLLGTVGRGVGPQSGAGKLEAQLAAVTACREYCAALAAITTAAASRDQAFQLVSRTFGEDPATGGSPCLAAAASTSQVTAGIAGSGADPVFRRLVSGPQEFLWSYLVKESAARLQALWEEQVLAGTVGMAGQQAVPALLGPDGLAWRFANGPAAPFLTPGPSGYRAKERLGGSIPFESAFFVFMNRGAKTRAAVLAQGRAQTFSVGVKGLPTDSNTDARTRPHATRLELTCGGATQSLVNNNYPVGRTFTWSPDSCGDASLQIEVGDVVLSRRYAGAQGFAEFLREFKGGRRTFTAREFPGERSALARFGVQWITVNYEVTGSRELLQQTENLSGEVPRTIARGWNR